jgi:hypothetical protein
MKNAALLFRTEDDERKRFVAVLEIPPVAPDETVVRVQIVKDVRRKQ